MPVLFFKNAFAFQKFITCRSHISIRLNNTKYSVYEIQRIPIKNSANKQKKHATT